MGTVGVAEWHSPHLFLQYKRYDAMTEKKKTVRKSGLAALIDRLDEMFINAGLGGKSVQLDPEPNRFSRYILGASRKV